MGIINRFLLFVYALAIAFFSLGAGALFLQIVSPAVLDNEVHFLLSRWEFLAGAAVFFLLSVHFLGCSISIGQTAADNGETMLLQGENGEIKVTLSAVKSMLENVIQSVAGVSSAKVDLLLDSKKQNTAGVYLNVHLSLYQGKNVTAVSELVREKAAQAMQQTLGIENYILDIVIDDMSGASPAKKQRVV